MERQNGVETGRTDARPKPVADDKPRRFNAPGGRLAPFDRFGVDGIVKLRIVFRRVRRHAFTFSGVAFNRRRIGESLFCGKKKKEAKRGAAKLNSDAL